jgi:Tfp pilus assembly protein PilF
MKRKILFLVFVLAGIPFIFGQQKEAAEKLVGEGVAYHDKGDFTGAIARYDKALQLDKDNLMALAEKALTLVSMHKCEEAISLCKTAIEKHPGESELKLVYVTYGNALDELKKTDEAIEIYDEGIQFFPDFYQLHFNKGITLSSVKKYNEALLCFHKSAVLNPEHASSQNAIGRILQTQGKKIPALLAYSRFLVIEPQGARAEENLELLQKILKGNAKKTGAKSITINVDGAMLGDTTADGKPNENSFTTIDLLLSMDAALDFDKKMHKKKKSEVEVLIRKYKMICSTLQETKDLNHGFYWDYYAPYFIEMKEQDMITTFAYILLASSDNKEVSKWLKSHKSEIKKFYAWSEDFQWKGN